MQQEEPSTENETAVTVKARKLRFLVLVIPSVITGFLITFFLGRSMGYDPRVIGFAIVSGALMIMPIVYFLGYKRIE